MSLSMAAFSRYQPILSPTASKSKVGHWTPAAELDSFSSLLDRASGNSPVKTTYQHGYRELPGYGRIETVKVTEVTVGADGKPSTSVKELAVCPECGTISCSCLARVTLQTRLDEENAKGPKDKEVPQPFAMLPQAFHQLNPLGAAASANAPRRMLG